MAFTSLVNAGAAFLRDLLAQPLAIRFGAASVSMSFDGALMTAVLLMAGYAAFLYTKKVVSKESKKK